MTDTELEHVYGFANRAALRAGATYANAHLAGLRAVAEAVRADLLNATPS